VELWPTPETSWFVVPPSAVQPSGASGRNGASLPDFPQANTKNINAIEPNKRVVFIDSPLPDYASFLIELLKLISLRPTLAEC
jgi:hypothetical protein